MAGITVKVFESEFRLTFVKRGKTSVIQLKIHFMRDFQLAQCF